jgi:DNA-binding CsgD family transcriptional regulator
MNPQEIEKIIQEKVTNVWEPRHDDMGHRYANLKTGHIQRSVTTKLAILSKPHLISWAVKIGAQWLLQEDRLNRFATERFRGDMIKGMQLAHTDIRDDAGDVGTVAHNAAERYINEWIAIGERPNDIKLFAPRGCDSRAIASMRAVEAFFKKNDIVPLASEILVGDIRYSAGTLDLLCLMDGKLTLIDFKTSNAIDQTGYSAQVAAYKYFFEGMTGLKVKKTKILHLSKDYDKFTVYNVKYLPKAWKAFKSICYLYDWIYQTKNKVVKDIKRIKI